MIRNLIEIELGYINTNHPDFIDVISLVKNDRPKGKSDEYGNLSFDSEPPQREDDEEIPVSHSNFKFQKQPHKNSTDKSQILDAKLQHIQSVPKTRREEEKRGKMPT